MKTDAASTRIRVRRGRATHRWLVELRVTLRDLPIATWAPLGAFDTWEQARTFAFTHPAVTP